MKFGELVHEFISLKEEERRLLIREILKFCNDREAAKAIDEVLEKKTQKPC